jgi:crotonobetainyl-CoA:carnitine CoA-transferase CaiB-like acyl-CoA transferase
MTPEERAAWCSLRRADDAARDALAAGVAAAAMVPGYSTLDDPQMRARGFFQAVDNPLVGEQHYPTWPVRLSGGPAEIWTGPAPTLGQHTVEVLQELGVDDDELRRLEAEHVIGTVPVY